MSFATYMARAALRPLPLPVTEKQYQELKAEQKEQKLKRLYCLDQVISERAYYLAPEELKQDYFAESMEYADPDLYQQAKAEIEAMIQAGQLPEPIKLDIQAWSESLRGQEDDKAEYWPGDTEWTSEQAETLIQHYISGEALYKAGLPEWIKEIDTFEASRLPARYWIIEEPPPYVAIVQDPDEYNLDERGYFKTNFLMRHWPMASMESKTGAFSQIANFNVKTIKDSLKKVLARRDALEELGHVVGLALQEGIEAAIEDILKPALGRYNIFAVDLTPELRKVLKQEDLSEEEAARFNKQFEESDRTPGFLMAMDALMTFQPIRLEKIRPPAREVADMRSWISEQLGEAWWTGRYKSREPRSLLTKEAKDKLITIGEADLEEAENES